MEQTAQVAMQNFNIISSTLKQILEFVVGIVGNYGWSVVVFTLLIRLLLMPLDIQSKKSMKRMSTVQPKIQLLQKKYANDKEKLNQKMQELYKTEGINPMSGCLPTLLQFPILICMFTAMRVLANEHTVQMLMDIMAGKEVQLQSWLWIKNVFQPDSFMSTIIPAIGDKLTAIQGVNGSAILTAENVQNVVNFVASPEYVEIAKAYGADVVRFNAPVLFWNLSIPGDFNGLFILPILAAVSTWLSSKLLTPASAAPSADASGAANPANNKMMMYMMPVMSLFFCASYSGAFSIYWVAVNIIQIAQQYLLNIYFDKKAQQPKTEEVIKP